MEEWVKGLVDGVMGGNKVDGEEVVPGRRIRHPDGRTVEITSGQYWTDHGLSNFWYWREVLPDGRLARTEEHGYGWW